MIGRLRLVYAEGGGGGAEGLVGDEECHLCVFDRSKSHVATQLNQ